MSLLLLLAAVGCQPKSADRHDVRKEASPKEKVALRRPPAPKPQYKYDAPESLNCEREYGLDEIDNMPLAEALKVFRQQLICARAYLERVQFDTAVDAVQTGRILLDTHRSVMPAERYNRLRKEAEELERLIMGKKPPHHGTE